MIRRDFKASFNGFHLHSTFGVRHDRAGVVRLQPKELAVLVTLVRHASQLVNKEQIIQEVWGDSAPSDSSITRCISIIKSSLNKAAPGSASLIISIYGQGYCFVGTVSSSQYYINENSFNTLINCTPDFIAFKDGHGRWISTNQVGIKLYNLEGKVWLGKTDLELAEMLPPAYRSSLAACVDTDNLAWQRKSPTKSFEIAHESDGKKRHFEVVKTPTFNEDGTRNVLVVFGHDITDIVTATEKIRLADHVLANSREAVVVTDANNKIVSVNRAFTSISGYSEKEVIGKDPKILSSGRQSADFYQLMWQQINAEGVWRGEIWDRRKNGDIYPKWLDISSVHDLSGTLTNYIAIFSDISVQKSIEEQLEFLAFHDPLTQLPNRLLLRDRFDQAVATADREQALVAVLFVDLDKFKQVNDSLGHEVGDHLLKLVGKRLADVVRETDTVARFGGDEFVLLLTRLESVSTVTNIVEKILAAMSQPFFIGEEELHSSPSIGISMYPSDGTDFDTILKMADTSMYQAKGGGKNTYRFFTEQMNIDAIERYHLHTAIRKAFKNSEFILHYQPQYDLKTHKLTGTEALMRWDSYDHGVIPPSKFIPAAEDGGLIIQIGNWVLLEACSQAKKWQMAGCTPLKVAVNLSALQFRHGNLVATVKNILKQTSLDARFLELELTESILIQDVEGVLEILIELKRLGVSLSIDDFGTGYSSLTYLKRLPVDKLKIDQSFVRNMLVDFNDAAIVHSVIQLAHSFKIAVIAEGVETKEQVDHLLREGCDEVQGYYFGSPMIASEFHKLLQSSAHSIEQCK